jgi:hypothetical protein
MPEETTIDTAQYQSVLEKLAVFRTFGKSYEDYIRSLSRKDGTGLEQLVLMGNTREGFNSDTFLNETPAAIDHEARVYVDGKTPEMKKYVDQYRPQIIDGYTQGLNTAIQGGIAKIRKDISDKVTDPKKQKEVFEQNLPRVYQELGMILSELAPNEDYLKSKDSDKEVAEALQGIAELKDTTDEEAKSKVAGYMEQNRGTSSNFRNFRVDWNGMRDRQVAQYMRLIGKKALKQKGDNYEVDKEFIAKIYGGYEGVLDMTPEASKNNPKKD